MSNDTNIDIHLRADGGRQVVDDFNQIGDAAKRTDSQLQSFGSGGARGLNDFIGRVREAKSEFSDLLDGLGKMRNTGLVIGAVGAGGLGLARMFEQEYEDAGAIKARFKSLNEVQVGSGLRQAGDADAIEDLVNKTAELGHMDDDPLRNAAVMMESYSVKTRDLLTLLPLVKRQADTMHLSLEEVSNQVGKGYGARSIEGLKRSGVAFTPEELKAFDRVKELGDDAQTTAKWMEIVTTAIDRNSVRMGEGLTDAGQAAGDLERKFGDLKEGLGSGVSETFIDVENAISGAIDKVNAFEKAHPGFLKTAGKALTVVAGGAVLGGGAIAGLAVTGQAIVGYNALRSALGGVKGAADAASAAKHNLVAATLSDITAEKEKTGVAAAESKALALVGTAAEDNVTKLSLLQRASGFLARGIMPTFVKEAITDALASSFVFKNPIIGNMLGRAANLTVGGAAGAAALGAGAGLGVRSDMQSLGYGEGASDTAAIATGLSAATAAALFPPAAALIAAAEALRLGVDHFYSAPLERAATEGNGLAPDIEAKLPTMSKADQANAYSDKANELRAQRDKDNAAGEWDFQYGGGPSRARDINTEIETNSIFAAEMRKVAKKQQAQQEKAALEQPGLEEFRAREAKRQSQHLSGQSLTEDGDVHVEVRVTRKARPVDRDAREYQNSRR